MPCISTLISIRVAFSFLFLFLLIIYNLFNSFFLKNVIIFNCIQHSNHPYEALSDVSKLAYRGPHFNSFLCRLS